MEKKAKATLSEHVKESLLKEIVEGEFRNAHQLPSEDVLSQKYQVSRSTIRTALAALEKEGFISRRQGAGTRINRKALSFGLNLSYIEDLHKVIRCCGYTPTIHLLKYQEIFASSVPEVKELLKVGPDEKLLRADRLWKANNMPVIYFKDYLPTSFIKRPYTAEDLTGSFFDFVYEFCDEYVDHSSDEIEAVLPTEEVAKVLHVDKCTPLLLLAETFFNEAGTPLFQGYGYLVQGVIRINIKRSKL